MRPLVLGSLVCVLIQAAAARATTPAPPLTVDASFTRGLLTVRAAAREPLTDIRLSVTVPTALSVKIVEPRGHEVHPRAIGDDQVEYSLALAERLEPGTVTAIVALSVRDTADLPPSEIEVRVTGRTEDGG